MNRKQYKKLLILCNMFEKTIENFIDVQSKGLTIIEDPEAEDYMEVITILLSKIDKIREGREQASEVIDIEYLDNIKINGPNDTLF